MSAEGVFVFSDEGMKVVVLQVIVVHGSDGCESGGSERW